ncbi:MAG: hypothetical protein JSR45_11395 [Proteobacteria bacterium]|nr:hypothetical protein [Pseudomonadota bacterium]
MKRAAILAGALTLLAAGAAHAQDAGGPAWCERGAGQATPESVALGMAFVPSEYAQKKARVLLADKPAVPLDADLAAQLGVPSRFVLPNAWLVRGGGFEQPEGDPRPGVQVYYDHGASMIQVITFAPSQAADPLNWAVVVVTSGDVFQVRNSCSAAG